MGYDTEILSHISIKLIIYSSDLLGSYKFFDAFDSEGVEKVKDEYLDKILDAVKKENGVPEGISYDSVYATFGNFEPKNIQENALVCARMAIDLPTIMKNISEKWQQQNIQMPFELRCGIHTGERIKPSTMGYKLSLATRLEEVCPPGKIYLSQFFWDLVKNEIPCKKVGTVKAYEFDNPVKVYSVNLNKN